MRRFSAVMVVALAFSAIASAQEYPSRPIKVLVIDPPGGALDRLMRGVGSRMSKSLGQPVVIDNRPGGEGLIGLQACAHSAGDGYTLCAMSVGPMSLLPNLKKLPLDPAQDLVPITPMVSVSAVLYAAPSVPANNLTELIAAAKQRPGSFRYASFGNGSVPHIVFEYIKSRANIELLHVPYQGAAPALNAVLSGTTDLSFVSTGVVSEFIKANKLKALAVSGTTRSPMLPAVGTLTEQGVPYDLVSWFGLVAPKDTPAPIVDRIAREAAAAVNSADFKAELDANGFSPYTLTPADFSKYLVNERQRAAQIIQDGQVKMQ